MLIHIELYDIEGAEDILSHIGRSIKLGCVDGKHATSCLPSGDSQYSWEII